MKLGLKRAASLSCFGIIVRTHEPTIETRCLDTNSCPEYSFLALNFLKFREVMYFANREVMYFANRYQKDFFMASIEVSWFLSGARCLCKQFDQLIGNKNIKHKKI